MKKDDSVYEFIVFRSGEIENLNVLEEKDEGDSDEKSG